MARKAMSPQARALRGRILPRLLGGLVLYSAAFLVIVLWVNTNIVPVIADNVADLTSSWITLRPEQAEQMQDSETYNQNWQFFQQDDGTYLARDLTTYHNLRNLKVPAAVVLYLVGFVSIIARAVNRALGYFDQLSGAVAQLMADPNRPVELSDRLAITRAELTDIRAKALANERAAKAAEQRKNELVAYLAHDIRTPLTSMLGYLALLHEPEHLPDEARREYAGIAYEKAERLEGLVEEFFEITRYNLQSIPIERQNVGLRLFCQQVAEEFFPQAQARSIAIDVEAPEGELFFVDPDKFARALSNVVRNAVAYADPGTTVAVRARKTEGLVAIEVVDHGREISEAHLQSIFEKFFREDGARGSAQGGAGLGLAIAREIVTAHGGTIAAASELGTTTFTITVPERPAPPAPPAAGGAPR